MVIDTTSAQSSLETLLRFHSPASDCGTPQVPGAQVACSQTEYDAALHIYRAFVEDGLFEHPNLSVTQDGKPANTTGEDVAASIATLLGYNFNMSHGFQECNQIQAVWPSLVRLFFDGLN